MVLGTSGSGKTRFYVKPNMMESAQKKVFSGMIITDPKKELCIETADMMKKHGYNIKIFDVKDFSGDCWNPFDYFYDDTDVISFVKSSHTAIMIFFIFVPLFVIEIVQQEPMKKL